MASKPEDELKRLKARLKAIANGQVDGADDLKAASREAASLEKETKDEPD